MRIFSKLWRNYRLDIAGAILPIAAMMFPLIIGMAGVGVDVSSWMMSRRELQTAADAAALAGAWELANGGSDGDAEDTALREAVLNGYDSTTGTLDITITTGADGYRSVKADIRESVNVWFASMFMDTTVYASTSATAQEVEGGGYCVLGLDQTAIGAVSASGSVTVNTPNCGVAVNSDSGSALSLTGNVTMNVGDVRVVGDYAEGASVDFTYSSLRTNSTVTADPYSDLTIPSYTSCSNAQQRSGPTRYNSNATLSPGTFCGGLTVTGNNTITLNPGTYYIDGGDFNVSGGGSIVGNGVTIVLTNSGGSTYGSYGNIDISGNKSVLLEAPTTGNFAGVAVYQDRNAPASSRANRVIGTAGVEIQGVVYTPSREFQFGGNGKVNSSSTPLCTKLIAMRVNFNGNPAMDNDCTGSETRMIGNATARLVL